MALGDESFTAALCRLRSLIHKQGTDVAKIQAVKEADPFGLRTRHELLQNLSTMVDSLAAIHIHDDGASNVSDEDEPSSDSDEDGNSSEASDTTHESDPAPPVFSPGSEETLVSPATQALRGAKADLKLSSHRAKVPGCRTGRGGIACAKHVGRASLRFFRIDRNWVDALVDGALSLGNHFGTDVERANIKKQLNDYITNKSPGHEHTTQIPAYGFYLRSDLVTMFPDLRVEVLADADALRDTGVDPPTGAPLLRHEIVTDGVMMGFMDRVPGSPEFASLVFTQPAHQQRFAVARGLDTHQLKADIRRQYTVDQTIRTDDKSRHDALVEFLYHPPKASPSAAAHDESSSGDNVPVEDQGSSDNIFIWDSEPGSGKSDLRILRLPRFAEVQLKTLQDRMGDYGDGNNKKPYFQEDAATSALLAMQLNDPVYQLSIDLKGHPNTATVARLGPPSDESRSEIRTLNQLEPSQVKKLTFETGIGQDSSEEDESSSETDVEHDATFERHSSRRPHSASHSRHLAPHSSSFTQEPEGLRVLSVGEPAAPPKYDIQVGSNSVNNWGTIQLDQWNLDQDIIFSVLVKRNDTNQYKLVELDIEVALGPAGDAGGNFLMPFYRGPGAHMLTNLRFNVLPTLIEGDQTLFRLRVLPRAARGWIDASTVGEVSFLLGLASINQPAGVVNQVYVQSWAIYCKDPDAPDVGPGNTMRIDNPSTLVTVYR
ncbi:uncharacterized protein PG998_003077 [Apiospora kogelbergensis]|uniref:uncharacterized protein n=1 Tax=Apiospora kogelbergensis TaxID=1337665 RepID=UPI00312D3A1A